MGPRTRPGDDDPDTPPRWWWCLKHDRPEYDAGCPDRRRLGPFATEAEAAAALETATARNEIWAAEDEAEADDPWGDREREQYPPWS
ncbi:hypothetical protein RIF23_04400 [Lipingzhangella sp. LS1_29]|uniref:SPOR domain-containing protein n=1 Tax=Lipingzhangella rawalii TaxID=2055835 RepID=A0ABU2H2L7_9ACTN|nr:hypothetical protein [Lipingzhangella rawalii]MDS1269536.1 hypothetical protein [Lipingzhangella rawalii]